MTSVDRDLRRVLRVKALDEPIEPYSVLPSLGARPYHALLENPASGTALGRYSFLCTDPMLVFRSKRGTAWVGPPGDLRPMSEGPLETLSVLLQRFLPADDMPEGLPPLCGGAVGYLGYELLYLLESVPDTGLDDGSLDDCELVFYASVIATDALTQKSWLIANGFSPRQDVARAQAESRLGQLEDAVRTSRQAPPDAVREVLRARRAEILRTRGRLSEEQVSARGFSAALSRKEYLDVVRRAREHIFEGDAFEICTSNRFETRTALSAAELYGVLRVVNPAPFAAWLHSPSSDVLCSSPERFLSKGRDGWIEARPIKGTRPRGQTPESDAALRAELLASEKDRAENMMIVDLERNDLGRVCEFGTVHVPELMTVESHPFTHQLVSTVRGKLRPQLGPIDLLRATFPGGSITGAPKIEAMKLIDSLEPVKRGVFAGSIGYIGFDGTMDWNIVIRTFVKKADWLAFHVGGAVVADSEPADEYQELLDKAHGLITAFEIATERLGET